jgi:hypothetical protein
MPQRAPTTVGMAFNTSARGCTPTETAFMHMLLRNALKAESDHHAVAWADLDETVRADETDHRSVPIVSQTGELRLSLDCSEWKRSWSVQIFIAAEPQAILHVACMRSFSSSLHLIPNFWAGRSAARCTCGS